MKRRVATGRSPRSRSRKALDADIGSGSTSWNDETFDQLDELLDSETWIASTGQPSGARKDQ